jgi:hypothetical protein
LAASRRTRGGTGSDLLPTSGTPAEQLGPRPCEPANAAGPSSLCQQKFQKDLRAGQILNTSRDNRLPELGRAKIAALTDFNCSISFAAYFGNVVDNVYHPARKWLKDGQGPGDHE